MNRRQEELKAAALWAFVERLREEGDPLAAGLDGLSPADAEELSALLRMAQSLRLALDSTEGAPSASAKAFPRAAARVRTAIGARRESESDRTPRPSAAPQPRTGWRLLARHRWAAGLATAALAVGVLVGRNLPAPDPLTHPPAAVAALTHEQVRARVPQLIAGRLADAESRAILWHLAHCEECFTAYRMMHRASQHRSHESARFGLAFGAFDAGPRLLRPRVLGRTDSEREGASYDETPIP